MAPVARGLASSYRVVEPFQRGSGGRETLTVARHVADLHKIINVHAKDCHPVLLGSSWGAMLALAYAAAHPDSTGALILVSCGTFDLGARAALRRTIAERMTDDVRARLKCTDQLNQDQRLKASVRQCCRSTPVICWPHLMKTTTLMREPVTRRGTIWCVSRQKAFILRHSQRSKSRS
jgi:pimeloyl-ACP methyl ester carboxylesterase